MASKGKEISTGKGKRKHVDSTKTGHRKRRNAGVLQFFDIAAEEVGDDSDYSMDSLCNDNDVLEDTFDTSSICVGEIETSAPFQLLLQMDDMSVEELETMVQERYKTSSGLVTYAEDVYKTKQSFELDTELSSFESAIPSSQDPIIWKVKCRVGHESHLAVSLMQKYVDLQPLGKTLKITSAFAVDRVKGFLFIEAYKQCDLYEACKGLCGIYLKQVTCVPPKEISRLLTVRHKSSDIDVGSWVHVKNGKYKGDLAQVVAVNKSRRKATVKLIPRVDLQAIAEKIVGGVTAKKTVIPAQRLISSMELEEFRPLIQNRRDRDAGEVFEILNGMMLKDGYLYKKVPINSLSCGVIPSEDDILKFGPSKHDDFNDHEWLSQLYNEQERQLMVLQSDSLEIGFKVHDMVFISQKAIGVIISIEGEDSCNVLTDGLDEPVVMNVKLCELKKSSFGKKITALDHQHTIILTSDIVKIVNGPLKGKQGIVKQIFGGTVFLYDKTAEEYGGYLCCKAQNCEKVIYSSDGRTDKTCESVKSLVSAKKALQDSANNLDRSKPRDNCINKRVTFTVGQSLRIRTGHLKGYLCKVLSVWQSDITVKLDSQQKILTVDVQNLAEIGGQKKAIPKRTATPASSFLQASDSKSLKSMHHVLKKGDRISTNHNANVNARTNSASFVVNGETLANATLAGGRGNIGSWDRPKRFEGARSSGGRGGGRGGRDQLGRGKGGRGQFGRGRGEGRGGRGGRGGTNQFGRGRGEGQGVRGGRGGTNQFGRGRGEGQGVRGGRGGTNQFGSGRGEGRGGANHFGSTRGNGRGSSTNKFGRGRGSGRGGTTNHFARGNDSGQRSTNPFCRLDNNAGHNSYVEKPTTFVQRRGSGGRLRGGRGANRAGRTQQNYYGTKTGTSMFDVSKNAANFSGEQTKTTCPWTNNGNWNVEASCRKRGAQVMGDETDCWGKKIKDGYGWSRQ